MSKKVLKPIDFGRVNPTVESALSFNEDQLKELAELYEKTCSHLREGQLISGKIINMEDGVLLDVQYKSNGLIPRYEFTDHELKSLSVGDTIDVIISELETSDGEVSLSYEKAKALKAWERITKLFEEGKPVEGIVTQTVKGGLSVDIGIPAFLPGSQVDVQRITDFDQFIGQTITADIIKINKKRGNVIISRRKYLSEQRAHARRKAMETLKEDQVIQGIVKNITNYGVFIDIGGVDGLLHITDMTWGRISHPSELVKIGDTIAVKILSIDKDNSKISLGMKQMSSNPWSSLDPSVQVNSTIKGRISSITDYGLFVEVKDGVEGLVHISEISWVDRVENLNDLFKVSENIEALIVSLDKENRRMSLSVKQMKDDPWRSVKEKFKIGQQIKGPITNITDFGIFIQLTPGVDGLAHVSDLSWTEHIDHPNMYYKKGNDIEAVILGIDEESKKVSLGVKQLSDDPLDKFFKAHKVGDIIEGEISKFVNIGAFVKINDGLEGLVHNSELVAKNNAKFTKDGEELSIGSKHQLRITNINKDERKVDLSLSLTPRKQKVETTRQAPRRKQTVTSSAPKGKTQLQLAWEKLEQQEND
jgi:small subunit ribosomal protein S1